MTAPFELKLTRAYSKYGLSIVRYALSLELRSALGGLWSSVLMYAVIKISTNSRHSRPPLSWGSGL
jgi:hypothetical protein